MTVLDSVKAGQNYDVGDRLIVGVGNVGRQPKEATYTLYNPETDKLVFQTVRYGETKGFG